MAHVETLRGLLGEPLPFTEAVVLNARERATLARAATILARIRELRGDADDDTTTDVALASYVCEEWSQ